MLTLMLWEEDTVSGSGNWKRIYRTSVIVDPFNVIHIILLDAIIKPIAGIIIQEKSLKFDLVSSIEAFFKI